MKKHDDEVSSDHLSGSSYVVIFANHYNPDLSFDVVSCLRYHLFSEFGILWLRALPTCNLFQHCSCLA